MFPTGKTMFACLLVSCERVCTLVQFLLRLRFLRFVTTWLKSFWLRGNASCLSGPVRALCWPYYLCDAYSVLCRVKTAITLLMKGAVLALSMDVSPTSGNGCVISVNRLGCKDYGLLVPSLDGTMMILLLTQSLD